MNFKRKLYVSWLHLFRGPPLSGGGEPGHIYLFTKLMESLIGFTLGQADAVFPPCLVAIYLFNPFFFHKNNYFQKNSSPPPPSMLMVAPLLGLSINKVNQYASHPSSSISISLATSS